MPVDCCLKKRKLIPFRFFNLVVAVEQTIIVDCASFVVTLILKICKNESLVC